MTSALIVISPSPSTQDLQSRQMSRPLHIAGFCLSVARAANVISQPIADLNGVRIDVSFLQRRGVQIHIGAASIILNEAEAARSIPHLQFSYRHYFPFFNPSSTRRRMACEREPASLPSDHLAIWSKSSFGKRIPTKGSWPVAGRP